MIANTPHSIIAAAKLFAGFVLVCIATPVFAYTWTTYYVDSVSGNDSNNGTSTSTPWKTLTKVDSVTFNPGDCIRFKCGCTFTGLFYPLGSGDSNYPIWVDKYGTGNNPIIDGNGGPSAIYLENQQYWEFTNLEIVNSGTSVTDRRGIWIYLWSAGTKTHLYFSNLYIHNVNRGGTDTSKDADGIQFYTDVTVAGCHFDNVQISNCTISNVDGTGIVFSANGSSDGYIWSSSGDVLGGHGQRDTNVAIYNNVVKYVGGNGILPTKTAAPHVYNNVVDYSCLANSGAAIWSWDASNSLFEYNESGYTHFISSDGEALDADFFCSNTIFQYNYSHDTEGAGQTAFMDGSRYSRGWANTNPIFRYNISQNDGTLIGIAGPVDNVQFYNNTYYETASPTSHGPGTRKLLTSGDWSGTVNSAALKNNLFYFDSGGAFDSSTAITYDHNSFYGISTYPSDSNKITSNPLLVSPGGGGASLSSVDSYKLQTGSPLLGAGILISSNGGKDYWGNSVSSTAAPNIGAYNGAGVAVAGTGSNVVTNPGFETDGFWTYTPAGWSKWSNSNDDASYIESGNAHSGSWNGTHWKATAYQVYTYQNITGLANGTYSVRAWVKSSGGQKQSYLKAYNYSGSPMFVTIPTSSTWTQVTIANISVTNGQCEIGFWSDANGGNWINYDDLELRKM